MISIIFTLLLNMHMTSALEKPKLIYVGDPMCSWCYGISNELSKTLDHYGERLEVEVVMGGLRAGGGEEWNESFKTFLRHHWEDVGMRSGQPFAFKLLDQDYFNYDTEPSCRAVAAVGEIEKEKMMDFFKAIQYGFYVGNKDPKQVEFYMPICEELDIDFSVFSKMFASEEMKKKTLSHFQRSSELGARSFPTVMLEYKGQRHVIAKGYSTFEKMKTRIDSII
ncbi:MAG: DsbA family protein [Saprospiraceae bacterium]|nr:DsbA family protein [Saprospiraceae bacterium]